MAELDLKALGLDKKYKKLAKLGAEVKDLTIRHRDADAQAQDLMRRLEQAKQLDLDRDSQAIREGKEPAGPKQEPKIRSQLEAAERNRAIFLRALQQAQTDVGQHMARHAGELYRDVLQVRADLASKVSKLATEALPAYGQYRELEYTLRDLAPPTSEATADFPTVLGVHTRSSGEPDRGHVEGWLQHLIGLGASGATGPDRPGEPSGASEARSPGAA